ncbi:ABC transporter permease [Bryobacter aggregatus]|uniref:ABC transporter permease n=1 Tax=Bryobacter aggregatus TaxID=360054 RepID=UPI0004E1E3A6|nr:ABC transporter permease [Bryobacter aggregatus]
MNRFLNLFRRNTLDRQMEEEFQHHLELLEADFLKQGKSPEEARLFARREFGSAEAHKDQYRDGWGLPWLDDLLSDLRFAARQLRRSPSFSLIAILTMALGVGANTAIFTLVNAALLREAPYPQPDRLKEITKTRAGNIGYPVFDSRQYLHFRDNATAFSNIAAMRDKGSIAWLTLNAPTEVTIMRVTPNYFRALGILPVVGRDFRDKDPADSVVVSHRFAARSQGAATVNLGGQTHTVLGVLPEHFPSRDIDIYLPLLAIPIQDGDNTQVFGRLRDGLSSAEASQQATQLFQELAKAEYKNLPPELLITLQPYGSVDGRGFRQPLFVLSGAVMLILLISCANLANLLLARATVRTRELAIRGSLGAGRFRLARQLLAESLLLAILGGLAGLALAQVLLPLLVAVSPIKLFEIWDIKLDWTVLAYTFGISITTGLLFGLIPAWNASRVDLGETMKEGSGKTSAGATGAGLRRTFVIAEVALSVVLLVCAGTLMKGLYDLLALPSGADETRLIAAQMSLRGERYDTAAKAAQFFARGLERLSAIPNVESAAVTLALPLERGLNCAVIVPDSPDQPGKRKFMNWRYTSPNYLAALRVPLLKGRYLHDSDHSKSQPVAVISEEFARRYLPGLDPLGRSIVEHCGGETKRLIVGIVGNLRTNSLKDKPVPTLYVSIRQANDDIVKAAHTWFPMSWVIRTRDSGQGMQAQIEKELRAADPLQPIKSFATLDELRGVALRLDRFLAYLIAAFACLALALSAAGIYGVLSYLVSQRTSEFAIRLALGADGKALAWDVLKQGLWLTLIGALLGTAAAFALLRWIASQVPGFLPSSGAGAEWILATCCGVLLLTACVASLAPAVRILRLHPNEALRAS